MKHSIIIIHRYLAFTIVLLNLVTAELYKPAKSIPCSTSSSCPKKWPCCSQYGECGAGPMCIIGCNPKFSFNEESCSPMPALLHPNFVSYSSSFESIKLLEEMPNENVRKKRGLYPEFNLHSFERMNPTDDIFISDIRSKMKNKRLINHVEYLMTKNITEAEGMLNDFDFTYSGYTDIDNSTDTIQLKMPKKSTGSLLSSSRVMLYGKISVNMRTARSRGVISAIVLMSSTGDEIDFEFLGSELYGVQTNYYSQGELVYLNMQHHHIPKNTFENNHIYEIDWREDRIFWLIDGKVVRTLYKSDTWNEEKKTYKFPQTPMRLEIAVWPGGSESNEPGTIEWAGGKIDWENSEDIVEKGYFHLDVEDIRISPVENHLTEKFDDCYLKLANESDSNWVEEPDYSKAVYIYKGIHNKRANVQSISIDCNRVTHINGFQDSNVQSNTEGNNITNPPKNDIQFNHKNITNSCTNASTYSTSKDQLKHNRSDVKLRATSSGNSLFNTKNPFHTLLKQLGQNFTFSYIISFLMMNNHPN